MTYLSCPDAPATTDYATVHLAWELSKADWNWKLGVLLPGARQMSRFTIKGGDLAAVAARLAAVRAKAAKSGLPVRILSCYEAGFEGHWLHRWLEGQGVVCHEVDPSSIEVSRRARRAKTDRVDLARTMRAFLAHLRGEPLACSIVHAPTSEVPQGGRKLPSLDCPTIDAKPPFAKSRLGCKLCLLADSGSGREAPSAIVEGPP